MKTAVIQKRRTQGHVLVPTVLFCGLLGISIVGYLMLVEQQSRLSARSQSWNIAIALVEAGIEDALQHLNQNRTNLNSDGWTASGTCYTHNKTLSDGNSYEVTINVANSSLPEIICQSYVQSMGIAQAPPAVIFAAVGTSGTSDVISRRVRVRCSRGSLFIAALAAKKQIDMKGNDILTDSFNSSDPFYSNFGAYDPNKVKDKGDVSSNDTILNTINVGNANIYGHVSTGPGGTVAIGPNGGVGSHDWQSLNSGFQDGWVSHDANFTFPDTTMPTWVGATPGPGSVTEAVVTVVNGVTNISFVTTAYDYVLLDGKYVVSQLSGKTYVKGKAELKVLNGINMSGHDILKVGPHGKLTSWVGGTSSSVGGNGVINNTGFAANCILYFTPTVEKLSFSGNGEFVGIIVAPEAATTLNGGGNSVNDYIGCLMANSVTLNGHFEFHYDEALEDLDGSGRYLVTSWDELTVQ
jgi:Tfp pilus assembly protein PilX